jgi:membrane protein DedA with SNARE-associated domain
MGADLGSPSRWGHVTWRSRREDRVEQSVQAVLLALAAVPAIAIYAICAAWLGIESAGVGVPIEIILLFEGSLVAQQKVNLVLAIVCCSLGCLLFASIAYIIGRRAGAVAVARVGRYVGLNQTRAEHIELWLRHRGALGVFIARVTPMVRTYSSYIMGAAEIAIPSFVLGTFVGSLLYNGVFITLGMVLGRDYAKPLHYLDDLGFTGVAIAALAVLLLLVLHHFWGRLTLRSIARHFHRHHAQHRPETAPASAVRPASDPAQG